MKTIQSFRGVALAAVLSLTVFGSQAFAAESAAMDILKQGLLGAGTGAISAGVSGGKAGKGALIGAGTNVIGGALLNFLTGSSNSAPAQTYAPAYSSAPQPVYQSQPVYQPQPTYVYYQQPQPVYQQPQPVYQSQPVYYRERPRVRRSAPAYYNYQQPQAQTNPNMQIIRQGLLGAGTGAIAASVSGGKAGQGALVGAGTNVIGGALLDILTQA